MPVTFSLGLAAMLEDPNAEEPGGFCRDELLFHLIDFGKAAGEVAPYFEVREVLSADLPMACGSEDHTGDLVVIARDGVGGAFAPDVAEHLLSRWADTPKRATVAASPAELDLAGRTIVVPEPFPDLQIPRKAHPFAGARIRSARHVRAALRAAEHLDGEVDQAIAMLNLCAVHGFVVSAVVH